MSLLNRILITTVAIVFALLALGGGTVTYLVASDYPRVNGDITVPGLSATVDVYRDDWGVPHIYADTPADLFFAQGYVQAQDRFWQMEFWRHTGSGRLSEIFGPSTLNTDRFIRTIGWRRAAEADLAILSTADRAVLQSFADGVNAYLAQNPTPALEFTILSLIGARYTPEPWTPLDSLTWAKVMAYDLGGNYDSELSRLLLYQTVGPQAVADLYPPYDYDRFPVMLPDFAPSGVAVPEATITSLLAANADLRALREATAPDLGSNNWTISGDLTDTGLPYLANDPHLGIQQPSIWYEVGLHCRTVSPACPYDARGYSFSAAPGIIIGHNANIAWGVTNVGPDVQDLFIEKLNPADPTQYEVNGEWVQADVVEELIFVRGYVEPADYPDAELFYDAATDITTLALPVVITRNGPIMSGVFSVDDKFTTSDSPTGELPAQYGLALRWTANEPGSVLPAFLGLNTAANFDDFRAALRSYTAPSQNFVYADVQGNIGYQMPGLIPIRPGDYNGLFPVPGWTDDAQWTGYVPFEELPYTYNPERGYVITANNAVVGPDYPYIISLEWDYGHRARRIEELVQQFSTDGDGITRDEIALIQGDSQHPNFAEIRPYLETLEVSGAAADARDRLLAWDGFSSTDSVGASIYHTFWANLVILTLLDDVGRDNLVGIGNHSMEVLYPFLPDASHTYWDDSTTPATESRDDIFVRALNATVNQLTERLGDNPQNWTWGTLHTANFRHATLGESGVGLIEAIFNRENFATSGGTSHVNATGYGNLTTFFDDGQFDFRLSSVPSLRMIVDLNDLDNSLSMHTTGQSGHPYHQHYADFMRPWSRVEYHPMVYGLEQVQANRASHLVLQPAP